MVKKSIDLLAKEIFNLSSFVFYLNNSIYLILFVLISNLCVANYSILCKLLSESCLSLLMILCGFLAKVIIHFLNPKIQKNSMFVICPIDKIFFPRLETW